MRFLTFELIAYGPFTGTLLDLSGGEEGIHLIYGANEAGKSSALRALTNLLYGIPPRSSDNFLHSHQDLRIGGKIRRSNGDNLHFVRRKGNKNTCLSSSGAPLPDNTLSPFLGDVTRDLFRMIYGMDHSRLVEGGKELATAKGDIGTSLFSAGMGIAGMKGVMMSLDHEAGELFKPMARKKPKVTRLISHFHEVTKQCRQKSLSANSWVVHDRQLKRTAQGKEEVERKLRELRTECHRLERIQKAIPIIARLGGLRKELRQMGDVMLLPEDFPDQRRSIQEALGRSESTLARLENNLKTATESISIISPAASLILYQEDINQLFLHSGSHKKALMDLPRRKADLHRFNDEAKAVLKRLGVAYSLEDAETFRLGDAQIARIRKLGRELDPMTERIQASKKTISEIEREVESAKQKRSDLAGDRDTGRLEKAWNNAVKQGDLEGRCKNAKIDLASRHREAGISLAGLGLWQGSLEELVSLPVPTGETLSRFDNEFTKITARVERIEEDIFRQKEQMTALDREAEEMQAVGAIPTEAELSAARGHRDKGWQLILNAWLENRLDTEKRRAFLTDAGPRHGDRDLAEAYAVSVENADQISDRLRNESDRVAKLATCMARRGECERKEALLATDLATVLDSKNRLKEEWSALWAKLHITPLKPRDMEAWLLKHQNLMKMAADLRDKEAEIDQITDLIAQHRSELNTALGELGHLPDVTGENLVNLMHRTETVIKGVVERRREHETLTAAIMKLERQQRQVETDCQQAEQSLKNWRQQWALAIGPLGLDAQSLPEEVDAVLDRTQQLFDRLDKAQEMRGRIRAIEADAKKFVEEVEKLCNKLSSDLNDQQPEDAVAHLHERLKKALADDARREELEKQKDSLRHVIQKERAIIDEATARMKNLRQIAGNAPLDALPQMERKSVAALEKQIKIEELTEELAAYSAGTDITEFVESVESVDFDSLPAEIEDLNAGIKTLEAERSELDQAIGSERAVLKLMDGGADASELAEQSQSILAEMGEAVGQYARIQLASTILRMEIERYREANQGPILRRAGEIFRQLTLESFTGLRPEYDEKDQPVLTGIRTSKEKVRIEAMSDGTRDQLYLALRLAGIEQRLLTDEPVPLILDDILVNFDNERSRATLAVLSEFSKRNQVIFFTHHRHLVELAKATVDRDLLFSHSLE